MFMTNWYVINFSCFFVSSADFLKIFFFWYYFKHNVRMSNSLDPDRARPFFRTWSGSKLFATVYPRLVEFLHFDIHWAEITLRQHRGNGHRNALFLFFESEKNIQRSDVCADFSSKYDVFTSLFNNLSLYWAFSIFSPQTMHKNSFVDGVKCILVKVLTCVTVLSIFILTHPINWNYIWAPIM